MRVQFEGVGCQPTSVLNVYLAKEQHIRERMKEKEAAYSDFFLVAVGMAWQKSMTLEMVACPIKPSDNHCSKGQY